MRQLKNWLEAYVEYASFSEAPKRMHYWSGMSAIAGALRRRVWIDMAYFKWYANMYVIIVAPPGIVQKSTTAGIAMNLLRQVPGINFGPDSVTWQALVTTFASATECFSIGEELYPMSAITLESSEFGNLLNPHDRDMVDLLVTLWDGKQGTFSKITKMSGSDKIENPWINIIACTTPAWIAGNFPEYMIGGGFTSRCVFVYAEEKDKYVPYPNLVVPANLRTLEKALVHDLEYIATNFVGEYKLTKEAVDWGTSWYESHYRNKPDSLNDDRFGGYLARKQTHIHKVAMVLAAAEHDSMEITAKNLQEANEAVSELEKDLPKVFARIGRSDTSVQAERFITFVQKRKAVLYTEAYRFIHSYFPDMKEFEGIVSGAIRAGFIRLEQRGNEYWLVAVDK